MHFSFFFPSEMSLVRFRVFRVFWPTSDCFCCKKLLLLHHEQITSPFGWVIIWAVQMDPCRLLLFWVVVLFYLAQTATFGNVPPPFSRWLEDGQTSLNQCSPTVVILLKLVWCQHLLYKNKNTDIIHAAVPSELKHHTNHDFAARARGNWLSAFGAFSNNTIKI